MTSVPSLTATLSTQLGKAITAALPDAAGTDPLVRRSEHADFQANGLLPLAKARRTNPRALAEQIAVGLGPDDTIASVTVAGPGFLNIAATERALWQQVAARAADNRLGVAQSAEGITVIDYSQPNIAKEMHVGHLRSTIIGDALARILTDLGSTVIRQNHLGDWGTQFGMLIEYFNEHPGQRHQDPTDGGPSISRLSALYRAARERFDADPAFADRSRRRVVALQAGEPETMAVWREIVAESTTYFNAIYAQLDVLLTDDDAVGESFYNTALPKVVADLEATGVAVRSDGAVCIFSDTIKGPDGNPAPLIIQKSDDGYGYATTDLAAIRYRVDTLKADRILYIVDARQALHFKMVFDAARRAGWLPEDVEATHAAFGTVLGPDGKPFKTRAGQTVRLADLLDAAVEHARGVLAEKSPHLTGDDLDLRATQVGIGAIKYADLSTGRTRDYAFDLERMLSLNGNTGVYLQYAYARIRSLQRRADLTPAPVQIDLPMANAERQLALHLDGFGDAVNVVASTLEPHRLCTYLFELAQNFTTFYESCPVLKAEPATRDNRLHLCDLTGRTLQAGMHLLGIATPPEL